MPPREALSQTTLRGNHRYGDGPYLRLWPIGPFCDGTHTIADSEKSDKLR